MVVYLIEIMPSEMRAPRALRWPTALAPSSVASPRRSAPTVYVTGKPGGAGMVAVARGRVQPGCGAGDAIAPIRLARSERISPGRRRDGPGAVNALGARAPRWRHRHRNDRFTLDGFENLVARIALVHLLVRIGVHRMYVLAVPGQRSVEQLIDRLELRATTRRMPDDPDARTWSAGCAATHWGPLVVGRLLGERMDFLLGCRLPDGELGSSPNGR